MNKFVKSYWPFTLNQIKSNFVYKGKFYLTILRKFLGLFVYYYLWMAIYSGASGTELGGFTRMEMIIYVIMSYTISDVIMVSISSEIGYDVMDGNIAMQLIKPINYRIQLIFKSFGIMIYRMTVPSVFIWIILEIYKVAVLEMSISNPVTIILFILSMFLSFLIYVLFDYCFGLIAFITTYMFGMNIVKNAVLSLLTGKLIPITFFPGFIQKIFEFMPFTSMTYTPVMIYMEKYNGLELLFQMGKQGIWVVLLYVLGTLLWKNIEKRIVIMGG